MAIEDGLRTRLEKVRREQERLCWEKAFASGFPELADVPVQTAAGWSLRDGEGLWPTEFNAMKWLRSEGVTQQVTGSFDAVLASRIIFAWESCTEQAIAELENMMKPVQGSAIYSFQGGSFSSIDFSIPAPHWKGAVFDGDVEAFVVIPEVGWIIQLDPIKNLGPYGLILARGNPWVKDASRI